MSNVKAGYKKARGGQTKKMALFYKVAGSWTVMSIGVDYLVGVRVINVIND